MFPAFSPCYVLPTELAAYGLPNPDEQPDIVMLVQMASTIIDVACGRIDGDGNGSLCYTTYVQRTLLQTRNRNLVTVNAKPIVGVSAGMVASLQAAATGSYVIPGATGQINCYYTGVQSSTITTFDGASLSGLLGASGRYGYTRQDMSVGYPDLWSFVNPLNLVTVFGGPAPWVVMDIGNTDYDWKTGELWIPAGLQLQRYSEVLLMYNSGYNPFAMPPAVKFACSSITKNALAKGSATTALMKMNLGKSGLNYAMSPQLLDPTLDALLAPYKTIRAY